ncbi:MAG: RraA family protein [Burkholderiales bacterium]|jgi:RraA family protein|nr:RraA family protein [Burkholderiales bacterium]
MGHSSSYPEIRKHFERTAPELVAAARELPAAILADVYGRRGTLHGRITAVSPTMKVAGPAITVEVRPGDNLMIHAALAIAQPGDVIVVDGKGDQTCALIGEIMTTQAQQAGLAGMVLDAAARDVEALRANGFPVFSVGANPAGPTKFVPGRVNWPIAIAGVTVNPGDLVVGDTDGVVVIERERVAEMIELGRKKVADETARIAAIRQGRLVPHWLADALRAAGVKSGEAA